MMNIWPKKGCLSRAVQIYVQLPTIPLINSNIDMMSEKDYFKIKLHRNPMLEASGIYIRRNLWPKGDFWV